MSAPRKHSIRRHCPVCHGKVMPTLRDCIEWHRDTIFRPCMGSGKPYRITLTAVPARKSNRLAVAS